RLYIYSYHPDLSAEEIYAEFVRWGDRFPVPADDRFPALSREPARRLRVGYVSPDFRQHTSRFFFEPLFAHHDKSQVELYAYSNVLREDEHSERFKKLFDHWRPIRGVGDRAAAELIRGDGIDILVDCCNHMADDRLGIFTLKPAPVQVTWLGAAWTTGLPMVDYVLFDRHMAPEGTLTREKIIRLPGCFVAFRPPEGTAAVAPLPALKNGQVTFGYSGRTERLNHKVFRAWAEILKRLPEARLILDFAPFADPPTQAYYREFLGGQGIDIKRVILRKSENIFEGLGDIDILLDCFPHSGGTMLFDALWMGVPFVTLASRPPVGRIGTSLKRNLGLDEWVAADEGEYIEKAVAFAKDIPALAVLRASLRSRMKQSPLMDEEGFCRGVEAAYRSMWQTWCRAA
ncbi:MAG: glycosyltransferase, partial [Sterolibacterium sp.]|nr:glycosyltransferase [Sterolibacterium sp.]